MARASHVVVFLVFSNLAVAMGATPPSLDPFVGKCKSSCEEELNLSLYLHQVFAGAAHNQEVILNPGFANSFGEIAVHDWTIHAAPNATSSIIARAKGMHMQVTQNQQANGFAWFLPFSMVFEDSSFGGSTLQVIGTISGANGEWAIMGGTGKLSMACGTVNFTEVQPQSNPSTEKYGKIDIHAFYTPSPAV